MKANLSVNLGNLLLSLSETMDLSNPWIQQHQYRTAYVALEISKAVGLPRETLENIFTAALLHDIGAITVEEKVAIHDIKAESDDIHPIRGALLLDQIPWLRKISKIVRYHHREWRSWDAGIEDPVAFSSQVVMLADYVERLTDRNKYILHQINDISDAVKKLGDGIINRKVVALFLEVAKREEFWLDLVSPRLYSLLLHHGPFHSIHIGLDDIALISTLYRDLIDFKSRYTATHTSGVSECAVKLAELQGLAEIDLKSMRIAGNFHDVGKLVIPNSIIEKPGRLTHDEYAIMRCHTYYTYNTLDSIGGLQRIAEWAAFHHEKLDGSGYPFHCKDAEINTGARIVAVADIFTAISEDRPYRRGMGKNEIYRIIGAQADEKLLDKRVVDLLFDNYDSIYSHVKGKQETALQFYENRFLTMTA